MYVVNLKMDNSPKWLLFNIVSDQITSNAMWKSVCKYSHTNSYNFAMALILQDDHLTAGAWAACACTEKNTV